MAEEEDPYALSSSESEDDGPKRPIKIESRSSDLKQLRGALSEYTKSALFENKTPVKDEAREEELAALKQGNELKKMKQDFESGTVHNIENEGDEKTEERQKITEIGKEKYSKFKSKFENIDATMEEELGQKLNRLQKEQIEGLGKATLASAKQRFENGESDNVIEKSVVDIERSVDLLKMRAAFQDSPKEENQNCCICDKTVYPVEKVVANKKLYHVQCFKCCKCSKKLTPTNFNSHEGKILCKVHMLEVFHPELAKTMDPTNTEEDEHVASDEEEFAVSSKPKQLVGVVKSGAGAVQDELAQLKSLREKKGDFESSCKQLDNVEKRTQIDADLLAAGRVKANAERFVSGTALEQSDDESESTERDPNIIRGTKKPNKESLNFEKVGELKSKWAEGNVETAKSEEAAERKELENLKGGVSVKDRFKERNENDNLVVERSWNKDELDTSAAAEARKSFMAGSAYDAAPVEKSSKDLGEINFGQLKGFKDRFEKEMENVEVQKTTVDLGDGVQLGNIKATFENGTRDESDMTPEERAQLKKQEIEAEFQAYKLARKVAAMKAQEEADEAGNNGAADVGSIKDRFDKGEAFKSSENKDKQLDVEVKMAEKAREKFRQIDASGAEPVLPQQKKPSEPSKWDKKDDKPAAEVINKRTVESEPQEDDEEDAFDVKNLMNKFKSIGETGGKTTKANTEQRAELEALSSAAREFKAKFEGSGDTEDAPAAEARRKQMEEEFETMKNHSLLIRSSNTVGTVRNVLESFDSRIGQVAKYLEEGSRIY
uniref:LIM zinc-binding domain-containing protein n=2 Tax=Caenorhabditis japonica TaxID=281687 RepID=A0A8R1I094_CAEJA